MINFLKYFFVIALLLASSLSQAQFSFDVGYSLGSSNGESYSEFNLGVNYAVNEFMAWRNSAFHRSFSNDQIDSRYGLDTSLQFTQALQIDEQNQFKLFGGPGWRFISEGKQPPFADAGIELSLYPIRFRAGAKVILNKVVDSAIDNETQYFISFSGSGTVGN